MINNYCYSKHALRHPALDAGFVPRHHQRHKCRIKSGMTFMPSVRHPEQRRGILKRFLQNFVLFGMTVLVITLVSPAFAEEKEAKKEAEPTKQLADILEESILPADAVTYAPDDCDFQLTFPGKPFTAKRCPSGPSSCTTLTSYTMVYDVTTTIEVSVTCVPSTPAKYEAYSEPVIATALKGMVDRGNINEHEINTREEGDMRQGSLLGTATRGRQNSIYNAQLWIGQNSIMTIESRLVGPYHIEADTIFSDILASVKKKDVKVQP